MPPDLSRDGCVATYEKRAQGVVGRPKALPRSSLGRQSNGLVGTPIAANSRPHIAFCWRAASVMTSTTPAL